MVNKHMKRSWTLLVIEKVKIKAIHTPEWLKLKRLMSMGKDVEQPEPSFIVSRNVNWHNFGKDSDIIYSS